VDYEQMLVERMLELRHDPLGCVLFSFPWGEPGSDLAKIAGPRAFQRKALSELGAHLENPETRYKPFRKAFSSGHGIGKSSLIGMIVHWAKSTAIDCKVLITANTGDQLKTKTQPEIAKWFRMAINKDWFDVHVTSIKVIDSEHQDTWRADFATWSEDNPQAFAGAHNQGKRLVIVFDEAAGIPDSIWKTVSGALSDADTEIIWIACSQAFRSEGAFYEAVFGDQRHRWNPEIIDSRSVEGTNVEEINEEIALYGENSDHVRVRWLGQFPLAGGGKFIDLELVQTAQKREPRSLPDDPLVAGVDFAWGGSDDNVIRFRKGLDARSIPPVKVKGEFTKDPAVMVGKLVDVLAKTYNGDKVAMLFFDSAGIAAPVANRLRALGNKNIMEVNFGAASPGEHAAYYRDYMWAEMKEWLRDGGSIDADHDLASDLQKPILVSDRLQRIKLESKDDMKKRLAKMGLDSSSPDDGDALALTFAMKVAPRKAASAPRPYDPRTAQNAWMG
jgi:hypothetical protein